MLNFKPHPYAGTKQTLEGPEGPLTIDFPNQSFYAMTDKYSFLAARYSDELDESAAGWYTSWQDRYNGGSASNTREGPFLTLQAAEANCRRILKALLMKN